MAIQKLAHCELRVNDLSKALEYNTELFGLKLMAKQGKTIYLGCGLDKNYDLAITEGGTGIAHMAYQVASDDDLEYYQKRLRDMGVTVRESSDAEPSQKRAISFDLPGTSKPIAMELILPADRPQYLHPALSVNRSIHGVAPLDLDHINLKVPDTKKLAEFLTKGLDFGISDIFQPAPGVWGAVWTRAGEYHHDLAFMRGQNSEETLSHIAFTFENIDHMKRALDILALHELNLEFGLGRHGIGANIYAYFWAPGGNRYELTCEMPRVVDKTAPARIWDDIHTGISSWGLSQPESFIKGS